MWGGWFSDTDQPSDFSSAEMPTLNIQAVIVTSIFVVPYLAFLIILPGVREKRTITMVVFTITLFMGASLGAVLYYPGWTGGRAHILAQFRAHANERMKARIGVNVGLRSVNITLKFETLAYSDDFSTNIDMQHLYYNEKFDISSVSSMIEALRSAHLHGLPYPMLSVLEYFSLNQDAFDWGRHYRTAGHYTHAAVWFGMACWGLSCAFLLFLPHHFGQSILATGLSSLFACLLYLIMSPCKLRIGFVGVDGERIHMDMSFTWAFYLCFSVGLIGVAFGILLIILQHFRIYTLSTFLEASLDETVARKRRNTSHSGEDLANSLEVMRRCKSSAVSSSNIDGKKSGASSGFQSRTSYTASLRSQSSFESVHDEDGLERSPSCLTVNSIKKNEIRLRVGDLQ